MSISGNASGGLRQQEITYVWVKGHAENLDNERCDRLATAAADGEDLLIDEGVE